MRSTRPAPFHVPPLRRAAAVAAVVPLLALAACNAGGSTQGSGTGAQADSPATTGAAAPSSAAIVSFNVNRGATSVPVDTTLKASISDGKLESVTVRGPEGRLDGALGSDGTAWTASGLLEPGTTYRVQAKGVDAAGVAVSKAMSFRTEALDVKTQQVFPSIAPLDGEKVGVGMPVIVTFDLPVKDRASIEKHLTVTSSPVQQGAWHWISDTEVHWRPKSYWKPGTKVHVAADINSVSAGGGVYGQKDRESDFTVGDAHVYKVNAQTHQMQVYSNGKLLRTLPITTGKPGFITRSGVKVIIEKFASKRMNSETVGIGGSEAYDIDNVQWAMRLTYSGEFIHAAPWSVGSQGRANVSHGCTGMSTANAKWLYDLSRRGDVVETTGTDRPMEPGNGYGDWNIGWKAYEKGSALA
ncbi:L,D-transpeptidase family protein [Nocardioides sp. TRM66260-LWL]|uniref:L,D-transpeptidase n=1 Tax=Nocardioides sp. TRM66260-LWL TaxID=2874478 RepID=UPI001CC6464F|nr:Ig-like domain-containing protein [Nocardioides sp. TRM66260-LWL]MBZ5734329.1 L,D-transpeptidase family protein [Nocardioides sp. TRM66260-LWL]